jgi:hypothetical protein
MKYFLQDGFVQIPKIVYHDKNLTPGQLKTYIAIRSHRNNDDFLGCFPGLSTIGKITGFCKETTSRHVKNLEKLGHIKIKHRFNDSNSYTFPSESRLCNCIDLCNTSNKKSSLYWDYCLKNLDDLKNNIDELTNCFFHIYNRQPDYEDLDYFLKELDLAVEVSNL